MSASASTTASVVTGHISAEHFTVNVSPKMDKCCQRIAGNVLSKLVEFLACTKNQLEIIEKVRSEFDTLELQNKIKQLQGRVKIVHEQMVTHISTKILLPMLMKQQPNIDDSGTVELPFHFIAYAKMVSTMAKFYAIESANTFVNEEDTSSAAAPITNHSADTATAAAPLSSAQGKEK